MARMYWADSRFSGSAYRDPWVKLTRTLRLLQKSISSDPNGIYTKTCRNKKFSLCNLRCLLLQNLCPVSRGCRTVTYLSEKDAGNGAVRHNSLNIARITEGLLTVFSCPCPTSIIISSDRALRLLREAEALANKHLGKYGKRDHEQRPHQHAVPRVGKMLSQQIKEKPLDWRSKIRTRQLEREMTSACDVSTATYFRWSPKVYVKPGREGHAIRKH
jgi:hypothetical protein